MLAALRYRRLTGKGMKIDQSQVESTLNCIGIPFMEHAMTGTEPQRTGNPKHQQGEADTGGKHPQPPALQRWGAAASLPTADTWLCSTHSGNCPMASGG